MSAPPDDDDFRAWLAGVDDFSGATCNGPPEAVGTIPAQALTEGGVAVAVSMEAWFADPDDDELTYAAVSGNAGAVHRGGVRRHRLARSGYGGRRDGDGDRERSGRPERHPGD